MYRGMSVYEDKKKALLDCAVKPMLVEQVGSITPVENPGSTRMSELPVKKAGTICRGRHQQDTTLPW